ncbi:MAG TPA: glycosyltransferase family 9 protein [Thermoanaerobaculia bacterium]|nr:glycosyltransferase family 9 protein [Thermoanaerobaculia bacterium]
MHEPDLGPGSGPLSERPPGAPRILLVRLSAIGDCLHALPVVHELRRQIPEAWIGWAIEAAGHGLLAGHPEVDRFHRFPRAAGGGRGRALLGFRRELRAVGYDIAIDVQGLTKSGLVAWLSGAPERVGFADGGSRELNRVFLNRRLVPARRRRHVIDRNLALLGGLGLEVPERASWRLPEYPPAPELAAFLDALPGPRFVALNPGAAWPTKRWPVESFVELARRIAGELGHPVVVTWGSDEERAAAERIVGRPGAGPVLAPPTDLRQLAALLGRATLVVSGDTGPLHLAVALGVPTVAIFGSTDPARNGPYGEGHRTLVQDGELDCQFCWRTRCARSDLACLHRVEVAAVLEACRCAWAAGQEEAG